MSSKRDRPSSINTVPMGDESRALVPAGPPSPGRRSDSPPPLQVPRVSSAIPIVRPRYMTAAQRAASAAHFAELSRMTVPASSAPTEPSVRDATTAPARVPAARAPTVVIREIPEPAPPAAAPPPAAAAAPSPSASQPTVPQPAAPSAPPSAPPSRRDASAGAGDPGAGSSSGATAAPADGSPPPSPPSFLRFDASENTYGWITFFRRHCPFDSATLPEVNGSNARILGLLEFDPIDVLRALPLMGVEIELDSFSKHPKEGAVFFRKHDPTLKPRAMSALSRLRKAHRLIGSKDSAVNTLHRHKAEGTMPPSLLMTFPKVNPADVVAMDRSALGGQFNSAKEHLVKANRTLLDTVLSFREGQAAQARVDFAKLNNIDTLFQEILGQIPGYDASLSLTQRLARAALTLTALFYAFWVKASWHLERMTDELRREAQSARSFVDRPGPTAASADSEMADAPEPGSQFSAEDVTRLLARVNDLETRISSLSVRTQPARTASPTPPPRGTNAPRGGGSAGRGGRRGGRGSSPRPDARSRASSGRGTGGRGRGGAGGGSPVSSPRTRQSGGSPRGGGASASSRAAGAAGSAPRGRGAGGSAPQQGRGQTRGRGRGRATPSGGGRRVRFSDSPPQGGSPQRRGYNSSRAPGRSALRGSAGSRTN